MTERFDNGISVATGEFRRRLLQEAGMRPDLLTTTAYASLYKAVMGDPEEAVVGPVPAASTTINSLTCPEDATAESEQTDSAVAVMLVSDGQK